MFGFWQMKFWKTRTMSTYVIFNLCNYLAFGLCKQSIKIFEFVPVYHSLVLTVYIRVGFLHSVCCLH